MENTPDYNQSGEYNIPPQSSDYNQNGGNNIPPQPNNTSMQQDPNKAVMTMGEWFLTYIILMIPLINIIMLFVWAFGDGNENRKNYCRVQLIFMLIGVVLSVLFGSLLVGILYSAFKQQNISLSLISISRLFI